MMDSNDLQMDTDIMKSNLKKFYNKEAELRNQSQKDDWKVTQRNLFYNLIKSENKRTMLEIGAGTGHDSEFFKQNGLNVTAIDLSSEMVKACKMKGIEAYEMDFYEVLSLNKKFDCIWSMNSLLHVPKTDLLQVLQNINAILNEKGLFYMGVYGGEDTESNWINDVSDIPRYFSYYSENSLKAILSDVFDIISFNQFDVGRNIDFQAVVMRKK